MGRTLGVTSPLGIHFLRVGLLLAFYAEHKTFEFEERSCEDEVRGFEDEVRRLEDEVRRFEGEVERFEAPEIEVVVSS